MSKAAIEIGEKLEGAGMRSLWYEEDMDIDFALYELPNIWPAYSKLCLHPKTEDEFRESLKESVMCNPHYAFSVGLATRDNIPQNYICHGKGRGSWCTNPHSLRIEGNDVICSCGRVHYTFKDGAK